MNRSDWIEPLWEGPTLPTDGNVLRCLTCERGASRAGGSREHPPSKGPLTACRTFEAGVEQVFPGIAEQGVCEYEVQRAQQQVVWVHQVVADHREVTWAWNNKTEAWGTNHICRRSQWRAQTRLCLLLLVYCPQVKPVSFLLMKTTTNCMFAAKLQTGNVCTFSVDIQHPAEVEDFAHSTWMASIKHKQKIFK